jgi:hypothetical protein
MSHSASETTPPLGPIGAPVDDSDAATKKYVDDNAGPPPDLPDLATVLGEGNAAGGQSITDIDSLTIVPTAVQHPTTIADPSHPADLTEIFLVDNADGHLLHIQSDRVRVCDLHNFWSDGKLGFFSSGPVAQPVLFPIADPASATVEDVANAFNALLGALGGSGGLGLIYDFT